MLRDIRFALRNLARERRITILVMVCLALVVAGNTTVFSMLRSYILKPLPYPGIERLALFTESERTTAGDQSLISVASFLDYRSRNRTLEELAASIDSPVNLTGDGPPEQWQAEWATPNLLPMVGGRAVVGRGFVGADGKPGAARVAVLTWPLWQRRFGGDPSVIGRRVLLDRVPYEVIGVLAEDFDWIESKLDVWLPLVIDPTSLDRDKRTLFGIAKLAPGISPDQAREDLLQVSQALESQFPEAQRGYDASLRMFSEQFPGPEDTRLFGMLQGAGLLVLLIACANIANLLLARGSARRRELAMRVALGAGRMRILRQLLTESVVLALGGGVVGILLGLAGVRYLRLSLAGTLPTMILPRVDLQVLMFSLGISAAAGLFFGIVPAIQAVRERLNDVLREGGMRGATGRRRLASSLFVISEVAFALALLVGAGLLLRTFLDVQFGDQGFETKGALTWSVTLPEDEYPDDVSRAAFDERLIERVFALPNVSVAASTTVLPRSRNVPITDIELEHADGVEETKPSVSWLAVSPGYLDALGITLLRGRGLEVADRADAAAVAVVDQSFVDRFYGEAGAEVLGKRIGIRDQSREIVGVVRAVRQRRIGTLDGPKAQVYLPVDQVPQRTRSYLVRVSSGELESLAAPVRAAVAALDPNLPVAALRSLDDHIAEQFAGIDVLSGILAGFGALALALAALGVYGVLGYSVSQRRQEIGVRMAMGARQRDVLWMILGQGAKLTAIGLLIGVPLAWGVGKLVASSVGELISNPPLLLPAVAAGLVVTTMLASFLPARRASAVAPTVALRAD